MLNRNLFVNLNAGLNFIERFNLKEEYFDRHSDIHGVRHTYRVMAHCLVLGETLDLQVEAKSAFCGAFIHDMARRHDGKCHEHGGWAAESKLPLFAPLFNSIGLSDNDIEAVRTAVIWHSLPEELDPGHTFYKTVAILKDADALDRVRLKPGFFDLQYLRFPDTKNFVGYAGRLYQRTNNNEQMIFTDYLSYALELLA